jgi:hypothetical protein
MGSASSMELRECLEESQGIVKQETDSAEFSILTAIYNKSWPCKTFVLRTPDLLEIT